MRLWFAMLLAVALAACGSDPPTGPGNGTQMPPQLDATRIRLLEELLFDSYSVEALVDLLLDSETVKPLRVEEKRLASDLRGRDYRAYGRTLDRFESAVEAYATGPDFTPGERVVIDALGLYVAESRAVLEDTAIWLPRMLEDEG